MKLYLASTSPRRAELLQQFHLPFTTVIAPIEETGLPKESAESYVLRMAVEKAFSGYNKVLGSQIWVIGSDTAVLVDGKLFGKPKHQTDAKRMLTQLSGRVHQVLSSVAVLTDGEVFSALNITQVTFKVLTEQDIQAYWQSSEPLGKAGGYAIQGLGAQFIEKIEGSYSAVMGLPLFELHQLLTESGYFKHHE